MPAFRRGQWVKTTREVKVNIKAAGQDLVVTIPAPSLAIHHKVDTIHDVPVIDEKGAPVLDDAGKPKMRTVPGREYHLETGLPRTFEEGQTNGLVGVHFVDSETGMNTILEAALPPDAIEPLLDFSLIPEQRRSTMTTAKV